VVTNSAIFKYWERYPSRSHNLPQYTKYWPHEIQNWFNLGQIRNIPPDGSIDKYWRKCEAKLNKTQKASFDGTLIYVWWNIWKERNRRTFHHKDVQPSHWAVLIKDDILCDSTKSQLLLVFLVWWPFPFSFVFLVGAEAVLLCWFCSFVVLVVWSGRLAVVFLVIFLFPFFLSNKNRDAILLPSFQKTKQNSKKLNIYSLKTLTLMSQNMCMFSAQKICQ